MERPKKAMNTKEAEHQKDVLLLLWSGLRDLNPRSLGPKPSAIPNFAKPGNCETHYISSDP